MRNASTSRYSLTRRSAIRDRRDELPGLRRPLGSQPPPAAAAPATRDDEPAGVHVVRLGRHDLEVTRDGDGVTLRLPGALRLHGSADQILTLAETLLGALEDL